MGGEEIGHAYWTLSARMDQLERDMAKAESTVAKGVDDAAEEANKGLDKVEKRITQFSMATTAALVGIGALAVKTFTNFEFAIDQAGAVANATEKEMEALRGTALKLGADTAFSAGEAAAAMEELAAGGRSVAQIVGGEAAAAVSLAAAGNYDLAESARTIATTMDIWKDSSLDTTDVVNRLAGAANTSRFGVQDMSAAIAQGGGVAAAAGMSFADFATGIAATASSFASGSDAGTAYKTFIIGLTGNSLEAKAAIKELGLEFFTAEGAMRPMSEIVDELNQKLGPLSNEMQTVYLKQIFGNDAFRTGAALMKMTGQEFKALDDTMRKTDAAEVAARRMDNLKGDVEQLTGSLETAGISMGQTFAPALREGTQLATGAVNAFSGLEPEVQRNALAFGVLTAATPAVIAGVDKVRKGVEGLGKVMETTRGKFTVFSTGLLGAFAALDLIVGATTGEGLLSRAVKLFKDVDEAAESASESVRAYDLAIRGAGSSADPLLVGQIQVNAALNDFNDAMEHSGPFMSNFRGEATQTGAMFEILGGEIAGTINGMRSQGVAATELTDIYSKLDPRLQDVVAGHIDLDEIMADAEGEMRDSITSTEGYNEAMAALELEAAGVADVHERSLIPALDNTTGELTDGISAADLYTQALEDGEDAATAFKDALELMLTPLTSMNPAVIKLNTDIAILDVEISKLKNSQGELTEEQEDSLEAMEEQRDELVKQRDGFMDVTGAVDEYAQELSTMSGVSETEAKAAFLALGDAMVDAGRDGEDVDQVMRDITIAMRETDSSKAIEQFQLLRDELSPAEWEEAVKIIGPRLMEVIATSMESGPERVNMIERFRQLGLDAGGAISLGMTASMPDLEYMAQDLFENGVRKPFAEEGQFGSPSKVMIKYGRWVGEGLAVGVQESIPMGVGAVSDYIGAMREQIEIEAPTIAQEFEAAVGEMDFREGLVKGYGEFGADVIQAFTEGMATGKGGDSILRSIERMIEEAEDKGVPDARKMGREVIEAVLAGLNSGDPQLVQEGLDAVARFNEAIESEANKPGQTMIEGFWEGYNEAVRDTDLRDKIGDSGADFINALQEGLESGEPETLAQLGDHAEDLLATLTEGLSPDDSAAITKLFMDAVSGVISGEGEHWMQILLDLLAQIESAGASAAVESSQGNSGAQPTLVGYRKYTGLADYPTGRSDPLYLVGQSLYQVYPDGRKVLIRTIPEGEPISVGGYTPGLGREQDDAGWTGDFPTNVPLLGDGLRNVPYDGYLAAMHKGEAVLTPAQARDWRAGEQQSFSIPIHVHPSAGMDEQDLANKIGEVVEGVIERHYTEGAAEWGVPV